ncbi:MAG: hypothetical protein WGN25_15565 [Candidatus Electrothrix sp. GW3-4]
MHQKRLAEKGAAEIRQVLDLLSNTLENHDLVSDDGRIPELTEVREAGAP